MQKLLDFRRFGGSFQGVKRCGKCGRLSDLSKFHLCTRRGHQAWCKDCRRTYDARYHQRNRQRRLVQKRALDASYRAWYSSLKQGKSCADCGGVFPPVAMQWDHLPGQPKAGELANLIRKHNKSRILAEIEKCELVCSNCHAVRTLGRRGA
jgi:hypothetical protein